MTPTALATEDRILVMAPTSKDAATTRALLASAGISVEVCGTVDGLIEETERGAAAVLVPEEAMSSAFRVQLSRVLAQQEPWSDLPVLVLARPGANSLESSEAVRTLGNVTLLERPLQTATLVSAVRTALRARARQIQIRGHLRDRAQAEESLRMADQRKDEFLATLGHELRNPLAPLVTGLHLLKATGVTEPRVMSVMAVMERQVQHLVRLVDDLLEVSRITRGLMEIRREPVDLVQVVRSAVETSRPMLDAAGHELVLDLSEEALTLGDGVRLTQVFANLLTNAAKYTNPGGRIVLRVERRGDCAVVSVTDNGIGIPAAHLGQVFDMFMQVDRSNRRAQGGLGIGLTLVRSLVALHGGRVEARSDGPGRGSTFTVELPMMSASAAATLRTTNTLASFPDVRILLVDDNADAADTLGALLASLGARVKVVNSGREALDIIASFTPDVALLDIGMPDMDGYALARRIRGLPECASVLLVALTGWGQDHDVAMARAAGFDHHLVKPPDVERLRSLVAVHLSATTQNPRS
jgi:signal transduction histidine kinase/ActR/RegA family two-component response regulator